MEPVKPIKATEYIMAIKATNAILEQLADGKDYPSPTLVDALIQKMITYCGFVISILGQHAVGSQFKFETVTIDVKRVQKMIAHLEKQPTLDNALYLRDLLQSMKERFKLYCEHPTVMRERASGDSALSLIPLDILRKIIMYAPEGSHPRETHFDPSTDGFVPRELSEPMWHRPLYDGLHTYTFPKKKSSGSKNPYGYDEFYIEMDGKRVLGFTPDNEKVKHIYDFIFNYNGSKKFMYVACSPAGTLCFLLGNSNTMGITRMRIMNEELVELDTVDHDQMMALLDPIVLSESNLGLFAGKSAMLHIKNVTGFSLFNNGTYMIQVIFQGYFVSDRQSIVFSLDKKFAALLPPFYYSFATNSAGDLLAYPQISGFSSASNRLTKYSEASAMYMQPQTVTIPSDASRLTPYLRRMDLVSPDYHMYVFIKNPMGRDLCICRFLRRLELGFYPFSSETFGAPMTTRSYMTTISPNGVYKNVTRATFDLPSIDAFFPITEGLMTDKQLFLYQMYINTEDAFKSDTYKLFVYDRTSPGGTAATQCSVGHCQSRVASSNELFCSDVCREHFATCEHM